MRRLDPRIVSLFFTTDSGINAGRNGACNTMTPLTTDAMWSERMAREFIDYSSMVVTRHEARAIGLKCYTVGDVCTFGHTPVLRRTDVGICAVCQRGMTRAWAAARIAPLRGKKLIARRDAPEGPITYELAVSLGLRHYTEAPVCGAGHIPVLRYTKTKWCAKCANAAARARQLKDPDKAKQYEQNSRLKPGFLQGGRDKAAAWRMRNPDYHAEYHRLNPECAKAGKHRRRARIKGSGGSHTKEQLRAMAIAQKHTCPFCKASIKKSYHVDHINPVSKGGTNDISNIQLLCGKCNRNKWHKDPFEWANSIGLLL